MREAHISATALEARVMHGRPIGRKPGRVAVVLHRDVAAGDLVTKIWERRDGFSSDWFVPYYRRFQHNAGELRRRGIDAPDVVALGRVRGTRRRYVTYRYMVGESLREIALSCGTIDRASFAAFLRALHEEGIYFRSLHLGNVLRRQGGRFALVDVTDTVFYRRPLPLDVRARNLKFLASYANDVACLGGETRLADDYLAACTSIDAERLRQALR